MYTWLFSYIFLYILFFTVDLIYRSIDRVCPRNFIISFIAFISSVILSFYLIFTNTHTGTDFENKTQQSNFMLCFTEISKRLIIFKLHNNKQGLTGLENDQPSCSYSSLHHVSDAVF